MSQNEIGRTVRTRVILKNDTSDTPNKILRSFAPEHKEVMEFKAVSIVSGYSRKDRNSYQEKKLGRTLVSLAIPGDSDRIRSPIRSAFYRAITPGGGSDRGGSKPGENRGYRCPEGYQYGGRFTDSLLSSCGAMLFAIAGLIGSAIGEQNKPGRIKKPIPTGGNPLTPGEYSGPTRGRAPEILIPRAASLNRKARLLEANRLVKQIGAADGRFVRLVRADGFVLEPVVPASVLRAIPDSRDMEGGHYILSARGQTEFGRDELGLLSNTGIQKITYVMPGGSNISIEKARTLTVGERRKLGRTVNTADSINISTDPTARLKYVASETGDGLKYTEEFVNIQNPHQPIKTGSLVRERWVNEIFGGRRKGRMKPLGTDRISTRETASNSAIGEQITTVEGAMARINGGGTLSDISPAILAEVLALGDLRERVISPSSSVVELGNRKYIYNKKPNTFEALSERFSEDVQQFLGLESPDVYLVGTGDKRKYLREDVESALIGAKIRRNSGWDDFGPEDVAKLFVADLVTDQRVRGVDSVEAMQIGDRIVPMASTNLSGGLMDLSKLEITKRQQMSIDALLGSILVARYSAYYRSLKSDRQAAMRRAVASMLSRAKKFNTRQYKQRQFSQGLSAGEKLHINMIETLYTNRVETLSNRGASIRAALEGPT